MKKILCAVMLSLLSAPSFANAIFEISGKVTELYASETGSIAVKLNTHNEYQSSAKAACPRYNGWTGNTNADPILKSVLLAAKASQTTIRISVRGCEADGAWAKAASVYMLNN
ncbi:hypothetical protein [Pseudoalteromonas piscicida]|uniref:Uncharacterized protein n=1 Tax=Pseudoalteromonas piscicida TaxID=43662 RepID=A0A2A5JJG9_PSEO7|nr:hypothetical protein [Pseudoalteromonas piscicida]PCK29590.1 hypothetical protein CEX98_22010 [Pseudoalteromonas piscicida]